MSIIYRHCEHREAIQSFFKRLWPKYWIAASLWLLAMTVVMMSAQAQEGTPPECRLLPDHKAQAGVAYEPGVDVYGRSVVPADINASPFQVPDVITVPLSINLAERLQHSNIEGLQLEAPMGLLEIHKNGRVVLDGQDWTSQVYALCGKTYTGPPPAPRKPQQVDGHKSSNAIKSDAKEIKPTQAIPPQGEMLQGGEYREERYR